MTFRELDTVVLERDIIECSLRRATLARSFTSIATQRLR